MVYNVLSLLKQNQKLDKCSITIPDSETINKRKHIFGRDIIDFDISHIRFRGGETGYEEFMISLENVLEIEIERKIIFRKNPIIKRIYSR